MKAAAKTSDDHKGTRPRSRRRPAGRLMLVIAASSYTLYPYVDRPDVMAEWCHVLRGPDGRQFAVMNDEPTFDEVKAAVFDGEAFPERFLCDACGPGRCVHVSALVEVGLL